MRIKEEVPISNMIGKVFKKIIRQDDFISFIINDKECFQMYHEYDCCEKVVIEDICGDLQELVGNPILLAEEVSNSDNKPKREYEIESFTWTFYKIANIKGDVTIRWFGESNGYYSEGVEIYHIKK